MSIDPQHLEQNRKSWNSRVESHLQSAFYDMPGFLSGNSSLKEPELEILGDVRRKSILHLQCHFGQDSISLSRMGAEVTGVDLSDKAIETAKQLAAECKTDAKFLCCNLYDLPSQLEGRFDIVFTTYGTISWLPDLHAWAEVIAHFLKPGGRFIFAEFHPVVWMFDDKFSRVGYDYFNTGVIFENESGTYADRQAEIETSSANWNHGMAEVLNSLLRNGLEISRLEEYDYSPWNCFLNTVETEPGKFRIAHLEKKIPMVYTILAKKKS